MINEELAELERLLAEIDGKKKGQLTSLCLAYERLGRIVSRDRDYWIATAREAETLRAENARLRGFTEKAEQTFRWYGDLHAAKPDPDKAKRNYDLADEARTTLAKIKDATDAD